MRSRAKNANSDLYGIYTEIGILVVSFSYIENEVEEFARILKITPSKSTIGQLWKNLRELNLGSYVDSLIDETELAFNERNKIIHGQIYGSSQSNKMHLTHSRSKTNRKELRTQDVQALVKQGRKLYKRWVVIKFGNFIFEEVR